MRELLERWAELEPQQCRFAVGHSDLVFVGPERGVLGETVTLFRLTEPLRNGGLLLAAVIEAITARGWSWEIRGSGCPASARVTAAEGTYRCVADEPTDPPAFPLLGAYLAALEAEAGQ